MKLLEALEIVNQRNAAGPPPAAPFRIALCCGFVPLHFKTFLVADIVRHRPTVAADVSEGLYGDLPGSLERLESSTADAIVTIVEWADLDPRLGMRSTGGWTAPQLPDLIRTAQMQLERIGRALTRHARVPRVLAGPTLPLPPVFHGRPYRLSGFEADLRIAVNAFYRDVLSSGVTVLSPFAVDRLSGLNTRMDIRSELAAGFPYTIEHAEALARLVASELFPPTRKKGLITDLDDTVWRGILGEAGVDGVCWTLERNAHIHALYQQFLDSLAASGTLVAVASKNDPALVEKALARPDLLLRTAALYPVEAHWGPKSHSVQRILAAWNIGADAVVFIDDSPMELAEVQAAYPDLECLLFPRDNPAKVWQLLTDLRDRFGVSEITAEDSLRLDSLRSRARFEAEKQTEATVDEFLRTVRAELAFATVKTADARAFELLNKTNQFNLNGARLTEVEWHAALADPRRFVVKASYTDRFGPLGNVAVLIGLPDRRELRVESWVMSCRAFSRRIEHRLLKYLFDRYDADVIHFAFTPTSRNGPMREFLSSVAGDGVAGPVVLSRQCFEEKCPPLQHEIREE
jgi:FkbH-like protein